MENKTKYDIRTIIKEKLKVIKRTPVILEAKIRPARISLFLNQQGGMQFHDGIRLLICFGFKIVDENGNIILGNPEKRTEELNDNTLQNIDL